MVLLLPAFILGARSFSRTGMTDARRQDAASFDGVRASIVLLTLAGLVTLLTQARSLPAGAPVGGNVILIVLVVLLAVREMGHDDPVVRR